MDRVGQKRARVPGAKGGGAKMRITYMYTIIFIIDVAGTK